MFLPVVKKELVMKVRSGSEVEGILMHVRAFLIPQAFVSPLTMRGCAHSVLHVGCRRLDAVVQSVASLRIRQKPLLRGSVSLFSPSFRGGPHAWTSHR